MFAPFQEYQETVRKQTDEELAEWTARFNPGSSSRFVGEFEMQRRLEQKQQQFKQAGARKAWMPIAISRLLAKTR
jgi:hypothetical protein